MANAINAKYQGNWLDDAFPDEIDCDVSKELVDSIQAGLTISQSQTVKLILHAFKCESCDCQAREILCDYLVEKTEEALFTLKNRQTKSKRHWLSPS